MFLNSGNGQTHFFRYLAHRFLVDAPENEYAAALRGKRFDDGLYLTQRVAGMELAFKAGVRLQHFEIRNCLEANDLVSPRVVDDEITRNGEEIGAPGCHGFPILRSIGPREDFRDRIFQFLRRRKDASQSPPQGCFVGKQRCFKPIQFRSNPIHSSPLCVFVWLIRPLRVFCSKAFEPWIRAAVHGRERPL